MLHLNRYNAMIPKIGTLIPALGIVLGGCATPYQHWLTDEEDAELRAQCEHAQCVMVPGEIWMRVLQVLRGDQRI